MGLHVVTSIILIMSLSLVEISYVYSSSVKLSATSDMPFTYYDYLGLSFTTTVNGDWLAGFWGYDTGGINVGHVYLINGTILDPLIPILDANSANGISDNNEDVILLTINNPTPDDGDYFGWSVTSTPNGDLFVGAHGDNTGGSNNAGSAYLFDGTNGDLLFEINNPTPDDDDSFGWSVTSTINGDLLVGTPNDNVGGNNAGSAYLFDGTNGDLLFEINNPESDLYNYFGYSVASTIYGDPIISAVHRNGTINVANSTASYIFMSSNDDNSTTIITTEFPIIIYDLTPQLFKFFKPFTVSTYGNSNNALGDD